MQNHIITYTKVIFYPLNPIKEDIKIEDIAHAQSLMTRANGHCSHFYSVAQHSLNCYKEAKARECSERVQLACLLHDASETYISDITRPVKQHLPDYIAIESRLQAMIYDRFGLGDLTETELAQIDDIDDTLLYYEFEVLMDYPIFEHIPQKAAEHQFTYEDHANVEKEYISVFQRLTGMKNKKSR
ncbi:HD domain-containing protein [Dehalobacter sp. DCM]|uniref:HD domain-containing protein n=1 Tax=Dehalobacter sp. DCM TaxID=2907827 RepID=UPI0030820A73|nr:HD domain-containing protein [Dehalobacter sp. DCM]